jgi:hypothetical protein
MDQPAGAVSGEMKGAGKPGFMERGLLGCFYLYHLHDYLRVKNSGLELDWTDFDGMIREWELWRRTYIPTGGVKGKTVLDIGACCGGTAKLFFDYGAAKVIAIERAPERVEMLKKNGNRFGWNMEVIPREFREEDLNIKRDFTKVDIEGYEMQLLEAPEKIGPCSLEAHNWFVHDRFKEIGFRELTVPIPMMGACIMGNWR